MPRRPPHILFLMDDQHRWDVCGFQGNPTIRTPNLDRLAKTGVVFDNAYTPSPVCVPGRQCIMSGQLPTTNGCRHYGDDLPPFSPTFASQLSEVGYATVCAGKLHHMGKDQMQGWTLRIGCDAEVDASHLGKDIAQRHKAYNETAPKAWNLQKELRMSGPGRNYFGENDIYSVSGALRYIEERFCGTTYDRVDHRPLLLKVSLQQPHYPYICSEEKFNYYINRVAPYPQRNGPIDHFFAKDWTHKPDVGQRECQRALAAYYGMVEEVDEHFGKILSALEAAGQNLDEWLIIYTTDHGDMLGEFDTWWKLKFYEGSVKVPLIIRSPSRFVGNRRIGYNVSLCDLYATLCDYAEASIPANRDSRSLRPLLEGNNNKWPDTAVSAYADHIMIKKGNLKYWKLHSDFEVIFNLSSDPHEEINLANDASYVDALADFRTEVSLLKNTEKF